MKSLYVAGAALAISLCTLVPAHASDASSEPDEVQVISVDEYQSSDDALAEEPSEESTGEELSGEPDAVVEPTELDAVIAAVEREANFKIEILSGEEEATVKTFKQKGRTITLVPSNPRLEPMVFKDDEVVIYGKVVTVIRRF